MRRHGIANDPVQGAGADASARLLEKRLRQVDQGLDVFTGLGGDKRHGHVAHGAE